MSIESSISSSLPVSGTTDSNFCVGNPFSHSTTHYIFSSQDEPTSYNEDLWENVRQIFPRNDPQQRILQKISHDMWLAATNFSFGLGNLIFNAFEHKIEEIPATDKALLVKDCKSRIKNSSIKITKCRDAVAAFANQDINHYFECVTPELAPLGSRVDLLNKKIFLSINNNQYFRSILFQIAKLNSFLIEDNQELCNQTLAHYLYHTVKSDKNTLNLIDYVTSECIQNNEWTLSSKESLMIRTFADYYYECENSGLNELRKHFFQKSCPVSQEDIWEEWAQTSMVVNQYLSTNTNRTFIEKITKRENEKIVKQIKLLSQRKV